MTRDDFPNWAQTPGGRRTWGRWLLWWRRITFMKDVRWDWESRR